MTVTMISLTLLMLLASVFALAAAAKCMSHQHFAAILGKLVPRPFVRFLATAIPASEILLAIWLLSGIASRSAAVVSIAVLGVFSMALLQRCGGWNWADADVSGKARPPSPPRRKAGFSAMPCSCSPP